MTKRVQAIERGIDVLMALAAGPKTLSEVSRNTGLTKATAFRLLVTLAYQNLVVKDANTYALGPGCLRLMHGATRGIGAITPIARPWLTALSASTGETVTIHTRLGRERICVAEIPSPDPIRYTATIGATAALTVGSASRVLIAFEPPADRAVTLAELDAGEQFRREVAEANEAGYALSAGERVPGAAAISVPIIGQGGFVAALSVLGPEFRLAEDRRRAMLPELREAAASIGAALAADSAPGLSSDGNVVD